MNQSAAVVNRDGTGRVVVDLDPAVWRERRFPWPTLRTVRTECFVAAGGAAAGAITMTLPAIPGARDVYLWLKRKQVEHAGEEVLSVMVPPGLWAIQVVDLLLVALHIYLDRFAETPDQQPCVLFYVPTLAPLETLGRRMLDDADARAPGSLERFRATLRVFQRYVTPCVATAAPAGGSGPR